MRQIQIFCFSILLTLTGLLAWGCEQKPEKAAPPPQVPVQGKDLNAAQAEAIAAVQTPQPSKQEVVKAVEQVPDAASAADPAAGPAANADEKLVPEPPQHAGGPTAFGKPQLAGYQGVALQELSAYEISAPRLKEKDPQKIREIADEEHKQIPKEIMELNGKKVVIAGYMLPTDFSQGKTNEFLLTKVIPSCFFCQQPMLNEWVDVKTLDAERVDYHGDDPILVAGVISVGIERDKSGYVSSIYRLVAEKVEKYSSPQPAPATP